MCKTKFAKLNPVLTIQKTPGSQFPKGISHSYEIPSIPKVVLSLLSSQDFTYDRSVVRFLPGLRV